MLLATWKVRVVKNVTKVMKTLAEAAGLGQLFQASVFYYTDRP